MNVTFIFLWENLHGHFEGNLCLMYVVTILLSFSIFIELGKDSFGYAFYVCSDGIPRALPWHIHFERTTALSLKENAPYFAINNMVPRYYVAKRKKKRNLRNISYNVIVWLF